MFVTFDDFLNLSKIEQRDAILKYGYILINYLQGDAVVNVYKVNHLFVKIWATEEKEHFEIYRDLSELKLFELPGTTTEF